MEKKWIASTEGKVAKLTLPLSLEAALGEQQEILDHQTDSQATTDLKHTRHGLACSNSVVCEARNCGHIVGQENPAFLRTPLQDSRVMDPGKCDVLNPHNVEVRLPPQQAADDIVVEVLVSGKTEHGSLTRIRMPGE